MNSHRIRHIIFDWNGTLLNDCDLAVATVNSLLADARRQPISREQYRRLFRFPIADLYRDLGFDTAGSNFRQLMQNYLSRFNAASRIRLMAHGKWLDQKTCDFPSCAGADNGDCVGIMRDRTSSPLLPQLIPSWRNERWRSSTWSGLRTTCGHSRLQDASSYPP